MTLSESDLAMVTCTAKWHNGACPTCHRRATKRARGCSDDWHENKCSRCQMTDD